MTREEFIRTEEEDLERYLDAEEHKTGKRPDPSVVLRTYRCHLCRFSCDRPEAIWDHLAVRHDANFYGVTLR